MAVFSEPFTFVESILIPLATVVYASSMADETTFEAISTGLAGFALGLPVDDQAADFLFRWRILFETIQKALFQNESSNDN